MWRPGRQTRRRRGPGGGKECGTGCDVWVWEPIAAREIGGVAGREMLGERLKGLRWRGVARSVASLLAYRVEREIGHEDACVKETNR